MFIKRAIESNVSLGIKQIPIIAIIGPRQSGKSTFIKHFFKNYSYFDMQDADNLNFAQNDPKGFLQNSRNNHGVIIDEAQYVPNIFPQLKVNVDEIPQNGYYILSGSQNFLLHSSISESLAGRVYMYSLLPFSIQELAKVNLLLSSPEEQIIQGFYPRTYKPHVQSCDYYENYLLTYIERDIRTIRNIDNLITFKKFMKLCALRIGSTINITSLAVSCGISTSTAKSWLDLLQTSFVIFLLPPYHQNQGKRIIKSPKLYFYDVGLASQLLGLTVDTMTKQRTVYGALFENMVVIDLLKQSLLMSPKPSLSFFRDSNQNEIDLIIEHLDTTILVEIKSSKTVASNFFSTLNWFKKQATKNCKLCVVYGGEQYQIRSNGSIFSWKKTVDIFPI
jgi:uncharacterized protein